MSQKIYKRPRPFSLVLDEARALYLTTFLRSLALSLAGIFVPIFVFNLSNKPVLVDSPITNHLVWVVIYYLSYCFWLNLAHLFLTKIIFKKLGFKYSIFLSSLTLILAIIFWLMTEKNFFFIFLASLFGGLTTHFYWIPFHILFVRKANRQGNFGDESAYQNLWLTAAESFGPLISGLMIESFGFALVFFTTIILLLVASVPVLFLVQEYPHGQHSLRNIFSDYFFSRRWRETSLAFAGSGVDNIIYSIFWPILLFLVLADFSQVGLLVSSTTLLSVILMLFTGRQIEKNKGEVLQKGSVLINSILYLPRLFKLSPLGLYLIDIVDRLNAQIYGVSFLAQIYDRAQLHSKVSDFIIYRELTMHLSQSAVLFVALAMILWLPNWQLVFLLAALGSALSYFIFIPQDQTRQQT